MKKSMNAYSELNNTALINKRAVESRTDILVLSFASVISILLIARDVAGIGLNKYIFLAISILFMAFADIQPLCYMVSFLIPLYNGLPGTYIRLATVLLFLIRSKGKIKGSVFGFIAVFTAFAFAERCIPSSSASPKRS